MTTPIKGSAPDFIASAFYHLGYRPSECVIMLGLMPTATGLRTGGATARVDLPAPEHRKAVARELASLTARSGCAAGFVIVVTTRPARQARAIGRAVRSAAARTGIPVVDLYQVSGDFYRGLECTDVRCCPAPGRPLSEVLDSAAAAAYVAEGMTLVASEADLIADVAGGTASVRPRAGSPSGEPAADGTAAEGGAPAEGAEEGVRPSATWWLESWFHALDAVDDAARLPPGFADALRDVALRDAVLLGMSGGSRDEALGSLDDDAYLDSFMTGRPDRERDARADRLLAEASHEATVPGRAETLAVLAWLAWWQGSGARSRLLVAETQRLDPAHRLVRFVEAALVGAVPPPWAELESAVGLRTGEVTTIEESAKRVRRERTVVPVRGPVV